MGTHIFPGMRLCPVSHVGRSRVDVGKVPDGNFISGLLSFLFVFIFLSQSQLLTTDRAHEIHFPLSRPVGEILGDVTQNHSWDDLSSSVLSDLVACLC